MMNDKSRKIWRDEMNCESAFVPSRISLVTVHTMRRAVSTTSRNYSRATQASVGVYVEYRKTLKHKSGVMADRNNCGLV